MFLCHNWPWKDKCFDYWKVNLIRRTYLAQHNKDKYYYKLSKSICFRILPMMQNSGNHVRFQDSLERCTG